MRISISGSHSTGKTVLAERCYSILSSRYPNKVNIIKEVARKVISKGFLLNQNATTDSYISYIFEQLRSEREAASQHVISDRSLVDLLAYIRTNADIKIPNYFVDMVEEITKLEVQYFDLYCYVPIEFPSVLDGVRPKQESYRVAIDKTLVDIFSEYKVHVEYITGSIENRCKKVLDILGNT